MNGIDLGTHGMVWHINEQKLIVNRDRKLANHGGGDTFFWDEGESR